MTQFQSFTGTVVSIEDFLTGNKKDTGCYKLISLMDRNKNIVRFVVSPSTFFVNQVMLVVGDIATGFYDINLPTPLIYPPQYRASVMAKFSPNQNVKVDFFNNQLISRDGSLKLNISPSTKIRLTNGQAFTKDVSNRNLIVIYGASTRSIPAQTTPDKIIVMCE